ncbi:hypothetical protein [Spartinivicinus ruber]|uniref:hypothetical protein n=1 Tax=Spartinivicinus ruber TaxID=2683272 RepID=UPI0013D45171|nr:hypothetical protein [Spartinivicinus ruber]
MTSNISNILKSLKKEVAESTVYLSDDENEQFFRNKNAKYKVLDFILERHSMYLSKKVNIHNFESEFDQAIEILQLNTGCAEDLEILEMILDELYDKKIINDKEYNDIISGTAASRWL